MLGLELTLNAQDK